MIGDKISQDESTSHSRSDPNAGSVKNPPSGEQAEEAMSKSDRVSTNSA